MSSTSSLLLLLLLISFQVAASDRTLTSLLAPNPRLSALHRLRSLTNLAPPRLHFHPAPTNLLPPQDHRQRLADVLSRHRVLPDVYGFHDVARLARESGTASTLCGVAASRAEPEMSAVKFAAEEAEGAIRVQLGSAGLIRRSLLEDSPILSVMEFSSRASSPSPSPSAAPAPALALAPGPSLVNITQIVESAGQFDTFLSLLTATKVADLFQSQANKTTTGITIFAPVDKAFSSLPSGLISKLTAQQKISLCEFHALSAFYPLSALQQATDPFTPTLATDNNGAGKFTVNISNKEGTVVISTGLTNAALISTLDNTVPCGVFAINQVLLPEDIFGLPAPSQAPSLLAPAASSPLPSGFFPTTAAGPSPETSHAPSGPAIRPLLSVILVVCGWKIFLL